MVTCPVSFLAVESPAAQTLEQCTVKSCEGLRFDPPGHKASGPEAEEFATGPRLRRQRPPQHALRLFFPCLQAPLCPGRGDLSVGTYVCCNGPYAALCSGGRPCLPGLVTVQTQAKHPGKMAQGAHLSCSACKPCRTTRDPGRSVSQLGFVDLIRSLCGFLFPPQIHGRTRLFLTWGDC